MNIAVMASGKGTNLQAIINAVKQGNIKADLKLVIGDVEDAFCLVRARRAGIRTVFVDPEKFNTKESFDKKVVKYLEKEKIDLIALAGFMKILSPYFIKKYKSKILNIHPALLPSFKGTMGIKDALDYGVKVTGVTVHFVNEELDSGPIILQEPVKIEENDTMESLEEKIHKAEHKLYPEAIGLFCENKLKIIGRKVKILLIVLAILFLSTAQCFSEDFKIRNRGASLPPELSVNEDIIISSVGYKQKADSFFSKEEEKKKNTWEPLAEEEFNKKTKEITYLSAKATAEFFDSIYMPYISRGLFNIIGTAYRIDKYHQKIKKEHGIDIDVEPEDSKVYLIYERKY